MNNKENHKVNQIIHKIRNKEFAVSKEKREMIDVVAEKVFHQYKDDLRELVS